MNEFKYQRAVLGIGASIMLAMTIGCATMEGKWSLTKVDPTAGRRHFEFESLTLQNDGTFYAEAREPDGTTAVSGKWALDDGVLSLIQQDGEQHSYKAELEDNGECLMLVGSWGNERITATFDKRS